MRALLTMLLAPSVCSGCGTAGPEWCLVCAAVVPQPQWCDVGIRVRAEFAFRGPIRRSIIDWKDENRREPRLRVQSWFAAGLKPLLAEVPDAVLVPVPPSPRSLRRRGGGVLEAAVRAALPGAEVQAWLQPLRNRRDQASLDREQRQWNLAHSMRWIGPVDRPIILVDDLLTTGATLRESARAMRHVGAAPKFGFVIAYRERHPPVAEPSARLRLP